MGWEGYARLSAGLICLTGILYVILAASLTLLKKHMSTTFQELTERTARRVNGANIGRPAQRWTTATIQEWLRDAIRDYSDHFPLLAQTAVSPIPDERSYNLPDSIRSVLTVTQPGRTLHPSRLARPQTSEFIFLPTRPPLLILGSDPDPAEPITILAQRDHPHDLDPADPITIPDHHHNILYAHVILSAWHHVRDNPPNHPNQVGDNNDAMQSGRSGAYQASMHYYTLLSQAKRNQEGQSTIISWRDEEFR